MELYILAGSILSSKSFFLYVRFVGDRSIQEKDFGRIQIDRIAEMQKWAENIKNVQSHTQ